MAGSSPGVNFPPKLGDRYAADQVVRAGPASAEAAGGDRPEAGGEGATRSSSGVDPATAGPSHQGGWGSREGLGSPAPLAGPAGQCEGHPLSLDSGAREGLGHVQWPGAGAGHLKRDAGVPAAPWFSPGQSVCSAAAVDGGRHAGRSGWPPETAPTH
uniref:Pleckstrin homology domain containing A4 n=1 Tax=Homo sapiens TaxID=9606 RepID=M0QXJ3_HUMAN